MKKSIVALAIASTMTISASALADVIAISNSADTFTMDNVQDAWKGKVKVQLIENAASADGFYKDIIGKSKSSVQKKLERKAFSGRIPAPIKKSTDAEVIAYVAKNPGSIGYIQESSYKKGVNGIRWCEPE